MAAELLESGTPSYPTSIGRYDVLGLLGRGGMAQVLLAVQRGVFASEKLVVIKQLRPEFASEPSFLNMFLDEARITLLLNHPNVVHTYEVVAQAPEYFLAMEFLEGQTLSRVVRKAGRGGLALDLQLWILTQVLAALAYAHELRALDGTPLGIVHRDVTPSNVQITTSGEVKLLDFGIAKAAGAISFTTEGVIKGKLGYVAPEQCLGRPFDARADVYSVGVMLWEAIAGRRRMSAETTAAALQARVTNNEPPIEQVVSDVPEELAAISRRALHPDPGGRYSSAAEFRADLEAFLTARGSRAGASLLGAEMTRLFADELSAQRAGIERYIQDARRTSTHIRTTDVPGRKVPSDAPTMVGGHHALSARAKSVAAIAVTALAAVVGTRLMMGKGDGAQAGLAATAPSVVTPAAAASAGRSLTQAPSATAPQPAFVRVECSTKPKRATLSLDGRPISNPYLERLPRDEAEHLLEVSAPGFRTVQRSLRLTDDIELFVELVPERARGGRQNGARAADAGGQPERALAGAPSAPASRVVDKPAATAEPGQDLRMAPRAAHSIDDKDPYQ